MHTYMPSYRSGVESVSFLFTKWRHLERYCETVPDVIDKNAKFWGFDYESLNNEFQRWYQQRDWCSFEGYYIQNNKVIATKQYKIKGDSCRIIRMQDGLKTVEYEFASNDKNIIESKWKGNPKYLEKANGISWKESKDQCYLSIRGNYFEDNK